MEFKEVIERIREDFFRIKMTLFKKYKVVFLLLKHDNVDN